MKWHKCPHKNIEPFAWYFKFLVNCLHYSYQSTAQEDLAAEPAVDANYYLSLSLLSHQVFPVIKYSTASPVFEVERISTSFFSLILVNHPCSVNEHWIWFLTYHQWLPIFLSLFRRHVTREMNWSVARVSCCSPTRNIHL